MPRPSVRRAELFSRVRTLLSTSCDNGVPIETIADLVGHASTAVTEEVYRHQIRPVVLYGAEAMDRIFADAAQTDSSKE
jgi:integrase